MMAGEDEAPCHPGLQAFLLPLVITESLGLGQHSFLFVLFYFVLQCLGIVSRALYMLGKC
jgi:hypothetical protein